MYKTKMSFNPYQSEPIPAEVYDDYKERKKEEAQEEAMEKYEIIKSWDKVRIEIETTIATRQYENVKPKIIVDLTIDQIQQENDEVQNMIDGTLDMLRTHLGRQVKIVHDKLNNNKGE